MKNNLIENDKIKTSLINQLKLNRKSIEILKPLNLIKKSDLFNSITTRKDNTKKKTFNKKYNFNSKLFASNNKLSIKLDSESDISIKNINTNEEFKSLPILSERSNEKIKNKIKKLSLKFSLNSLNKNTNKNKKHISRNSNISNFDSLYIPSSRTTSKDYLKNLDKYKNIFNTVSSRIKSSYDKSKLNNSRNYVQRNYSPKNSYLMNTWQSPQRKKYSFKLGSKTNLLQSSGKKKQYTIDDYNKTLNKEFNTKELIKIENNQIKQRLKEMKIKVYDKTPLFDTTEKLNVYLGREFNLDIRNLKKSFNKKYKVFTNSLNKIKEIKHKTLFSNNNNVFGYKISLDKNNDEDNDLYKLSDIDIKEALKSFYKYKAKDMLEKKLDLEKQLIELKNKYSFIIEQEKSEKNRLGINYGEINQAIQKKFLVREIYELDRKTKKKNFYDEQAKILYKTRNFLPKKVLRENLKQKTINKFKDITGVHFA